MDFTALKDYMDRLTAWRMPGNSIKVCLDGEEVLAVTIGAPFLKDTFDVNFEKAKEVAKMLTDLSTSVGDADALTNQYIANIKNICNS